MTGNATPNPRADWGIGGLLARITIGLLLLQWVIAFRYWMWPISSRVLPPDGVKVSTWKTSPGVAAMPFIGWIEIFTDHQCRVRAEWKGKVIYDRSESSKYDLSQMTAHVAGDPPSSGRLVIFEPFEGEMNDVITEDYSVAHYLNRRLQRK